MCVCVCVCVCVRVYHATCGEPIPAPQALALATI